MGGYEGVRIGMGYDVRIDQNGDVWIRDRAFYGTQTLWVSDTFKPGRFTYITGV